MGPVRATDHVWIDEMETFTHLHYQIGNWRIDKKGYRKFKEDTERFEGDSDAVLIYRITGQITDWSVYSFTEIPEQNLIVSLSDDDKTYYDSVSKRNSFYIGSG